ncbi:hypothetical protein CAPTEDRAFT_229321 [Capitella teleta]|uniref:Ubiquitin-like domain-containing protein n=1 Tax=Capitella teleta TaxID=283909 RepID=R7VMF7_CAPTE|nr:hypothetical protein CAPTEDRAFT_229321 [Capitella teleta]|eukprot:ELU18760.1 hypothetical protein CAPTEDRAFT_229321 [Capitella teleta]
MESGLPATGSGRLQPSAFSRDLPKSQDPPRTTGSDPEPLTNSKCQVHICPSTGGGFVLRVDLSDRVDLLKAIIGQKLRIPKERTHLLFKDRILSGGTLRENGIGHDSKITLMPSVHAGLKVNPTSIQHASPLSRPSSLQSQKTEHSMVQALENLSDGQVNDFICGRSPLTLAMRMGDHMMFVQLQLSTSPPSGRPQASRSSAPLRTTNKSYSSSTSSTPPSSPESSPAPSPFSPQESSASNSPSPSSALSSSASRFAFPPPAAMASPPSSPSAPRIPAQPHAHRTPVCVVRAANGAGSSVTALENAKRSLSLKLREFSQQASTTCSTELHQESPSPNNSGCSSPAPSPPSPSSSTSSTTNPSSAIIESMQHLGHGVYSGTFSGTLNPQLQDLDGRPKRSINTIIHILNDLLGASPQHCQATAAAAAAASALKRRHPAACASATDGCPAPSKRAKQEHEENAVMRAKVEQLQMMLEQRRLKRRKMEDKEEAEPGIVLS